jgi:hypothetical protein
VGVLVGRSGGSTLKGAVLVGGSGGALHVTFCPGSEAETASRRPVPARSSSTRRGSCKGKDDYQSADALPWHKPSIRIAILRKASHQLYHFKCLEDYVSAGGDGGRRSPERIKRNLYTSFAAASDCRTGAIIST